MSEQRVKIAAEMSEQGVKMAAALAGGADAAMEAVGGVRATVEEGLVGLATELASLETAVGAEGERVDAQMRQLGEEVAGAKVDLAAAVAQVQVVRERTRGPGCPQTSAGGLSAWSCSSCNQ